MLLYISIIIIIIQVEIVLLLETQIPVMLLQALAKPVKGSKQIHFELQQQTECSDSPALSVLFLSC